MNRLLAVTRMAATRMGRPLYVRLVRRHDDDEETEIKWVAD
jgi:hypothetical protein